MRMLLLMTLCTLVSCTAPEENSSKSLERTSMKTLNKESYNNRIMGIFSGKNFREVSCDAYGVGLFKKSQVKCIISTLTIEEVLGIIEEGVQEFASEGSWVEDYGQYHTGYLLKDDPTYEFGFGVSRVAYKPQAFKSNPDIWGKFESDIIFTPIYKRKE